MNVTNLKMSLQDKNNKVFSSTQTSRDQAQFVARSFAQLAKEMQFKANHGTPYLKVEVDTPNVVYEFQTFKLPLNKSTQSFYRWFNKKLDKLVSKTKVVES